MCRLIAMDSRFWVLLFSILVAWTEAKRRLKKQINENDLEKHKELVLSIQEVNKTQFFEQDTDKGEYQFGYQISPDGNFHHENRAPDGVTYGCYGYVDAYGTPVEYYYISDGWGYRTVMPNTPVEIFYHAHNPSAHGQDGVEENQVDGNENKDHSHHHEHHEHHGEIVPWNQLHFPKQCENKDFTLPPPQAGVSAFPSQPSQGVISGLPPGQAFPTLPSRPVITNGAVTGRPQPGTAKPQQSTPTPPTSHITGEAGLPERPQTQLPGQISGEYPGQQTKKPEISTTKYPLKPDASGLLPAGEAGIFPEKPGPQVPSRPTAIYPGPSVKPERPDTNVSSYPSKPKPDLPEQFSTEFPDKLIPGQPSAPGSPTQLQPGISERPGTSGTGIHEKPKPEFSGAFPTDSTGQTPRPTVPGSSGNEYPQKPQTEFQGGLPTGYPGQSSKPHTSVSSGKPLPEYPGSISGGRPGQSSRPIEHMRPGYPEQPSTTSGSGTSEIEYPQELQTGLPGKFPTTYPTHPAKPDISGTTGFPEKPELGYPSTFPIDFPNQSPRPTQPSQSVFPIRPSQPSGIEYPEKPQTGLSEKFPTEFPGKPVGPNTSQLSERPESGISGSQPTPPDATGISFPEKTQPEVGFASNLPDIPTRPTGYPQQPIKPSLSGSSGTGYPEESQTVLPGQLSTGHPGKPVFEVPGIFPTNFSQPSKPGYPEQSEFPEHPEELPTKIPGQPTQPSIIGSPATSYPEKPESGLTSQVPSGFFEQSTQTSEIGFPDLSEITQPGLLPTNYPGQISESVKPGQSFTSYPEKPESPGQRPIKYPTQPVRPSGPESSIPGGFSGQPFQPTQSSGLGGPEAGYPQRPQTGEIPGGFSGQPSQPSRPSTSVTSYPGNRIPGFPNTSSTTYREKPSGYPGYPVKPSSPGTTEIEYPKKPQTGLPEEFPTELPGQTSKPGLPGTGFSGRPKPGISSSLPMGFPGYLPQPTPSIQPGYPGQPSQPTSPEISGTGYSEKPQTELPGGFPTGYPNQPSKPSLSGIGSPEKPQPAFPSGFHEFSTRPEGYPQQPSKPESFEAEYPEGFPTRYPEHPSGPSMPGHSGTPQPEIPSTQSGGFPSQSLQPILPTQHSLTGQPSQPTGPGYFGTSYPPAPQTELPGESHTGYPIQPSQPETTGTDYPEKPQAGFSSGFPSFPTRPTEYPQQSTKPSKPESLETGYPQEFPTGYPSQPSQPPRPVTSGYPDKAQPEFSLSFSTDYPGQPSPGYQARPTRPSQVGTFGTEYPQKPQSELPGLRPTAYPEKPIQPSGSESSFPIGMPGPGYPQISQTGLPNELPTGFPGQLPHSPKPGTTSYPGKPQSGQISTIYPEQPHPTQPSEFPEKPHEFGTLVTGYPEKPGSGLSSSLPTKYPVQSQQPGQSSVNDSFTQPPQTGFLSSSTTGNPLQPNEFPDHFGTAYPGKPGSESTVQLPTPYPGESSKPESIGVGYSKPQAGSVGPSIPGFPGQVYPSRPSQPDITSSAYPQSPGFGSTGQPSTFYPSVPVTSPSPGISGTYSPHQPSGPSQKPFEPEYPTVGYFPSPSPSFPSHPSPGASFKPISQGMTTFVESSEISKYPSQKPTTGTEESTSAPNFVEDKSNCGGFQQPLCETTEKEIDFFTFTKPEDSSLPTSCLCDPKDVKCMLDCVNVDRQTTQKPFGGSTEVTTFKPTRPGKPTDLFCNCSPFDSECIKKCMEAKECDVSQGDCSFSEGSPGQPDYPTYPPPACGGPGQEDCPYPPAGIKPFPEFTYPTPLGTTENGNNIKISSEFPECQNKESEGCSRPTTSFEITTTKPISPNKVTTEIEKATIYPSYPQTPSFPPFNSKGPEFPTDFNKPFTETEFGTEKPSQGFSSVQKPGNGNLPSEPEREPTKPIQPTDSEKFPGEPVKPLGPEGLYQNTEKPYPIKPEYPGGPLGPFSPDQTSQTGYEGQPPTDSEPLIPVKPLEPTDSEKESQFPEQIYKPSGIGGGDFEKPVISQGASKPEEENLGGFTPQTVGARPGNAGHGFPDLGERPVDFGQGVSKPEKPVFPSAPSSKPNYGSGATSQTETSEIISFKPSQMPQIANGLPPSQPSEGEGPTEGFLIPESPGGAKPQSTSKHPEGTISSTPSVSGCDLSSSHCALGGAPPIYIIPYPVPIVPSPGSCPCYLVSPKNETSNVSTLRPSLPSSTQSPYPENFLPQGIIGYIPVVFYPYCPGNNTNSDMVQPYFPQAYPVPYPCQQCQNENNSQFTLKSSIIPQNIPSRPTRFTSSYLYSPVANGVPNFVQEAKFLKSNSFRTQRKSRRRILHKQESRDINSFEQVLKQGNIKSQQIVKSPHRSSQFGERIRPIARY